MIVLIFFFCEDGGIFWALKSLAIDFVLLTEVGLGDIAIFGFIVLTIAEVDGSLKFFPLLTPKEPV